MDASHSVSNLPAADLDLVAIRKYVSYGFAARNRYPNSYAGNVKYFGIGGIVGYSSNMKNSEDSAGMLLSALTLVQQAFL